MGPVTCGAVAGTQSVRRRRGEVPEELRHLRRVRGDAAAVFVTVAGAHGDFEASGRDRSVSARGSRPWAGSSCSSSSVRSLPQSVSGVPEKAVFCATQLEDNWQAQWSRCSGSNAGRRAVELHQVGVRNPMADDREGRLSDVNLGGRGSCRGVSYIYLLVSYLAAS